MTLFIKVVKSFLTFLIIWFTIPRVLAQDKLTLTDGRVLVVKILEVGDSEISYRLFNNLEGPVFRKKVKKVKKVVFENNSEWLPEQDSEKPTAIKRFDENRAFNKGLRLIGDSTDHHIISFHASFPDLDLIKYSWFMVSFHGGISYEWQPKGNRLGVRLMPIYSIGLVNKETVPRSVGWMGVSITPKYYPKNWNASQFYVGLEAIAGAYLPEPNLPDNRKKYVTSIIYNNGIPIGSEQVTVREKSIVAGAYFVFGGQIIDKRNINVNVDVGMGYRYLSYWYNYPENILPSEVEERKVWNNLSAFVRLGIGGRIKTK